MASVDTTVLIPTLNEGGNVEELVRQIETWLACENAEILFVDDSTDGTPDVIEGVAKQPSRTLPVRLLHRTGRQRVGGLSGAVVAGLAEARGEFVIVMDGDLQHPPSLLPQLRIRLGQADLVVASRYVATGDPSGLKSWHRRRVSSAATILTRACFPRIGKVCTDPMTGFFGVRRGAICLDRLEPRGFKILFEILATHELQVSEVPFAFGERRTGDSKAAWRNGLHFLQQLYVLRVRSAPRAAPRGMSQPADALASLVVAAERMADQDCHRVPSEWPDTRPCKSCIASTFTHPLTLAQ